MSNKNMYIICIIAILISGCQSQTEAAIFPTENATPVTIHTATPVATVTAIEIATTIETDVSSVPQQTLIFVSSQSCADANGLMPALSNTEIPFNLGPKSDTLGGGMVQSNEFTIELYLYCDENFQSDAKEQYHLSDIGGLAIYHNWRFDAAHQPVGVTGGRTFTFFGIDPDIQLRSGQGGGGLRQGQVSQGQSTGILFPSDTIPDFSENETMRFVYVMESPSGNLSGARLSFDLKQMPDGLQPTNIVVTSLSAIELKSMEYVKDQIQ